MDLRFNTLVQIIVFCLLLHGLQAQPQLGVASSISQDSILNAAGFKFIVEAAPQLVSPRSVSDSSFQHKLAQLSKLKVPVYALNIFIPSDLKLVGPNINEQEILDYTRKVFERCKLAGIELIVWGSGGARKIPDGFSHTTAQKQFIEIARKVSDQAARYNITLALENLNSTEANFITTVAEALEVVKAINRTNFRLCADIYHMLKENEPASVLLTVRGYLIHCDIAEKENRTPPGTRGDDFRMYLRALRQINYTGRLVLECRWNNLPVEAAATRIYLQQQINEVWDE